MNNFNMIAIEGNLTKDSVLKYTQNGKAMLSFAIANHSSYTKNGEIVNEVSYFDIIIWGELAEKFFQYLKKGRRIIVKGKLKQDRWQDETGNKHSIIKIIGDSIDFVSSSKNYNNGNNSNSQNFIKNAA